MPVVGAVEQSVLEHLAVAAEQFARREGDNERGYDEGIERLRIGADGVLHTGVVEARLAAGGGINHGEERGGDIDMGHAALVGGGSEAAEVADDAAADADEDIVARSAVGEEEVPYLLHGGEGLVLLAIGYL